MKLHAFLSLLLFGIWLGLFLGGVPLSGFVHILLILSLALFLIAVNPFQ